MIAKYKFITLKNQRHHIRVFYVIFLPFEQRYIIFVVLKIVWKKSGNRSTNFMCVLIILSEFAFVVIIFIDIT